MIFDQNRPGVKPVGINLDTLKKGKSYSEEDVLHTFRQITPDLDQKLERYDRGEISDPYKYAVAAVKNHIEIETEKMGCPVVAKGCYGGLRILQDNEAVDYLNSQANAGLRKHRRKTGQLFTHVSKKNLNDYEKKKLESLQRIQSFILASHTGARTQALRMKRKGLQLPDMKPIDNDDQSTDWED